MNRIIRLTGFFNRNQTKPNREHSHISYTFYEWLLLFSVLWMILLTLFGSIYLKINQRHVKNKSIFCTMVKNQFDITIQRIRNDNATEFTKGPLQPYLAMQGILHETSCVDTPQQMSV